MERVLWHETAGPQSVTDLQPEKTCVLEPSVGTRRL